MGAMLNVLKARSWADGTEPRDCRAIDAPLVAAAKRDPEAFSPLYRRYAEPIYRYCLRRLGDSHAAEDAMSAVFDRAFANLRRCDDASFRSWLFAIAHNVVVDRLRAERPSASLDVARDLEDRSPGPEQSAIASEERRSLARLLAQLTPDQRQVVELRLAGLTGVEIADALGRSHDAVKKLQARALLKLRELMAVATDDTR